MLPPEGMKPIFIPDPNQYPYHVSARCNNREHFDLELSEVWEIMSLYLYFIRHAYEVRIISFVLMSNHFHLLVKAPNGNLAAAMNYFMRETSKQISRQSGSINHIYGGTFGRTLIHNENYFLQAYKYVYRNPVEANLCTKVEEYRYSTLHGILGQRHLLIPIENDFTLFDSDVESTLHWLNQKPKPDNREAVKSALSRQIYRLPKSTEGRNRPHPLEVDLF